MVCVSIYCPHLTYQNYLGSDIFGRTLGPLGITSEQMTVGVLEHIFYNGPWPNPEPFPKENANLLKHGFNYFYPLPNAFLIRAKATQRSCCTTMLQFSLKTDGPEHPHE
jgi:hypothetical protein